MGKAVSKAARPVKNFNVENRASRVLESQKPRPAPRHPTTMAAFDNIAKEHPEYPEEQKKKHPKLEEYLKQVRVDSTGDNPEIRSKVQSSRSLPENRKKFEPAEYGFPDPDSIPEGRASLRQVLEFIGQHHLDPQQHTATSIAAEYKLDPVRVHHVLRSIYLWQPGGGRAVFGGQVIGQALAAATYSVPDDHHTHSLHCYFLRPGNVKQPILYTVDRMRDGNVYSNRNIKATQDGKAIFTMLASFKTAETDPYHHQFTMPAVPSPDECLDMKQLIKEKGTPTKAIAYQGRMEHGAFDSSMAYISRPVLKDLYNSTSAVPARLCLWLKSTGRIGDDHKLHQCCAAYMSDNMLLMTSILPHPEGYFKGRRNYFITSIDHAVWFHSDFRADEWLLYEMESPVCREGRAYTTGRMWTQDGRLAISVAQEGVIRTLKPITSDFNTASSKL